MKRFVGKTGVALALGLGLTAALLWLLQGGSTQVAAAPARAAPQAVAGVTRYVAVTGTNTSNDCTNSGNPCQTIQYAIDRPGDGDEIRVAGGTYTGVQVREGMTQVLFITETVTIRGGYSVDFSSWDPDTTPTTLDADELGRVVRVKTAEIGDITATLETLRLTSGAGYSSGGGIYVQDGDVIISGCHIYSNTAGHGGGGYLAGDSILLVGNRIYDNQASTEGGGIQVFSEPATMTGNHIYSNTAAYGGGVKTHVDGGVFEDNHVFANEASAWGGGLEVTWAPGATFAGNQIYSNTAPYGGGMYVDDSDGVTLSGNDIYSNTATAVVGGGGGVCVSSENVLLAGNAVFGNRAAASGAGVVLHQDSHNSTLSDNEIYSNTAGTSGAGVFIREAQTVTLTSNAIYSNTIELGGSGGGGVYLWVADGATLTGNEIHHNTLGTGRGGGVDCQSSDDVTLASNQIHHNSAAGNGGGVLLDTCHRGTLSSNDVAYNESRSGSAGGGGLSLDLSDDLTLTGNRVYSNTAGASGGIHLFNCDGATLINTLVADNQRSGAQSSGVGVRITLDAGDNVRMLHTTIARNGGAQDAGLRVSGAGGTAALTNTILVGHDEGVDVGSGASVTLQATLWGTATWSNTQDWAGSGTIITGSVNIWGEPGFLDPDEGDYHIGSNSAGRDEGVDVGVSDDIDGDPRPFGAGPDLGADEVQCNVRLNGAYYGTVQDAVDASTSQSDVVQVAGTCRGVGSGVAMVAITKTVTIRGGYSGDFGAWDPDAYPTTLDAQGEGGVIRLWKTGGEITPTLEALRITNGRAGGNGGGIEVLNAHPVISGCHIYSNTSGGSGGGVYISQGDNARLKNNVIYENSVTGGLKLGGGLFAQGTDNATLENNIVVDNWVGSSGSGSGIYLHTSSARLWHTTVARNTGGNGQGLVVVGTGASHGVWMTNTILVSHTVGIQTGGTVATAALSATLWGDGAWANGLDTVQGGGTNIYTGTFNWWGDPAFVDPDSYDYHLDAGSAAFDRGLSTSVSSDIDGDPRAVGPQPDLGADEAIPVLALTKSGPAQVDSGANITYTLYLTNTGVVTGYSVILTDAVPSGASFVTAIDGAESGGVVSWTAFNVPPIGVVVTRTFVVTTTEAITNVDYWATAQGMPAVAGTVAVHTQTDRWIYLPLVLRSY